MNDKMKQMIRYSKFEYFLNAVHYYICKAEVWLDHLIEKTMLKCFHIIYRAFGWESKYYKRIDELGINTEYQNYKFGKNGPSIGLAHRWFWSFYSCYPASLSFLLVGFANKILDYPNEFVFILCYPIPIVLCNIPAYKAVFTKDRYLKYFKKKSEKG